MPYQTRIDSFIGNFHIKVLRAICREYSLNCPNMATKLTVFNTVKEALQTGKITTNQIWVIAWKCATPLKNKP